TAAQTSATTSARAIVTLRRVTEAAWDA
ncbi:MAG: hypothetical protein QOI73_2368, partial [Solirubrobacteraceae bacterium]|nr:hypothetical protein [Solirubrobacteraceae bacterium]